jgi:hypothetical protein
MTKLTIKEEMRAIDTKNRSWYDSLTDDEKKKLSPWVLMRYTSNVKHDISDFEEHYLEWTNELVNVHFNTLRHHSELQFKLMQTVGLGKIMFHPWIAPGKKGGDSTKAHQTLGEIYKHLNGDEIDILVNQHSKEELTDLLEQYGYKPADIKKILK